MQLEGGERMESRICWACVVWPLALALQACGGSDGTTLFTGQVIEGPVVGAQVCAYTLATPRELIGCTATDASGTYLLDLPQTVGEVLIEATGGTYMDESTCLTTALVDPMRTVAQTDGTASMVLLTPFTELAFQRATPAGHTVPQNLAAFQVQVGVIESALGITGVTIGQPFGGDSVRDQMHRKALEAFSRQQSGQRASVAAVIADLSLVLDNCGASSVGAQLAVYGAAGLGRFGWRPRITVRGGPDELISTTFHNTSPIDLARSGLLVQGDKCLVPVMSGIGFAQLTVFNAPDPATGFVLLGIPKLTKFEIGGDEAGPSCPRAIARS